MERGGEVRSFHVERVNKATVNSIVEENITREARLLGGGVRGPRALSHRR
jgi:hypothetical protein